MRGRKGVRVASFDYEPFVSVKKNKNGEISHFSGIEVFLFFVKQIKENQRISCLIFNNE